MKKFLCILILLFCTGIASIAQTKLTGLTHLNIQNGVTATYTKSAGLVLSFNEKQMNAADKKAFAAGILIADQDIPLSGPECQSLGLASGKITKGSGPIIKKTRDSAKRKADTSEYAVGICIPGYIVKETLKIGGAEHKNDWPNK